MENPIYNETNENPAGFGMIGKPRCVQDGLLWDALVQTAECRVSNEDRKLIVARHRYKEHPRYLVALSLAKYCSELYPAAVVLDEPDLIARYCQARDEMREAYARFVSEHVRGSISFSAIKPTFKEMVEAA